VAGCTLLTWGESINNAETEERNKQRARGRES
jgi:hypothetical protein